MGTDTKQWPKRFLTQLLHGAVGIGDSLSRVLLAESQFHWEEVGRARAFSRNATLGKLGEGPDQDALAADANRFGDWKQEG